MQNEIIELTTPSLIDASKFLMEKAIEGYVIHHELTQIGYIYYVSVRPGDMEMPAVKGKPGRPKKEVKDE